MVYICFFHLQLEITYIEPKGSLFFASESFKRAYTLMRAITIIFSEFQLIDHMLRMETASEEIRAVVTSSIRLLTISQLAEDYKQLVGADVPIAALGFDSVRELLDAMPDTVCVFGGLVHLVLL